jgi:DNA polymerase-3 subunit epsilon
VLGVLSLVDMFNNKKEPGIDPSTPVEEIPCVVLDTELTGLELRKNSIVSVGAIAVTGTRIDFGNTLYMLVRPETALTSKSVVVHEIMPSDLLEVPDIATALQKVSDFIGSSVIVGHFISLDLGFINKYLKLFQNRVLRNQALDTCRLYDWLRSQEQGFGRHFAQDGQENKDLYTLARRYGVEVSGAHNALSDAFITAQVYQRLVKYLQRHGVQTLRDLLRIGKS